MTLTDLYEGFDMKRGALYCQKCGRKRTSRVCGHCKYDSVLIRLNYDKATYRYYCNKTGAAYTFKDAFADLLTINNEIKEKVFNPQDWLPKTVEGRKFVNAFEKWCDQTKAKLSPSFYRTRLVYFRTHYTYFYEMDVRDIKLKHLQIFYDSLPSKLSAKYKRNMVDCLRSFLNWLLRWGELKELPIMPEIQTPDSVPRQAISYEEQLEALSHIPIEHRGIIEFMMESGLRPGEACALKIGDITFRDRSMMVQRTYSETELRETTKGRHKMRVPLSDRACELIQDAIGNVLGDRFVFINPVTKRGYIPETVRKIWKKYSGSDVDMYSATRHSFCTQLVEMGMSEIEAQGIMRHKDARSTRSYFHPTQERQRGFLNQRGKVILLKKATDVDEG